MSDSRKDIEEAISTLEEDLDRLKYSSIGCLDKRVLEDLRHGILYAMAKKYSAPLVERLDRVMDKSAEVEATLLESK